MVNNSLQKHRGVSLVEVLVAILVIGIGMLGVMGLQGRALQHSQQSFLNSKAVLLANDMADRIRLNRDSATLYKMALNDPLPSVANDQCIANACTVAQLADWDKRRWLNEIASALPQGSGEITEDVANSEYTIIVNYVDEVRASDTSRTDSNKFSVQVKVKI